MEKDIPCKETPKESAASRRKKTIKIKARTNKGREKEKKRAVRSYKNSQKTLNKMAIHTFISIITLNVNGLNSPIKKHTS